MASIFIPEVFSDAINEKLGTTLRFGSVAVDATSLLPEIKTAGDTMHFPKIKRTATVKNIVKGSALTPAKLDMDDSKAVIKYIGSAFRIYDKDKAQVKGMLQDKHIDTDLAEECDKAVLKSACEGTNTITSAELQAGIDNFGDDVDTDSFAAIIVHPKLRSAFAGMAEFTNNALTYQTAGNGIVKNGCIGYYFGIPVIVTANGTWDSTATEAKTYIIKKNALGYVFQKNVTLEESRQALLLATDVVASSLYATKLLDDTGVVVVRKTIA
jgi:hypothetical protein